MIGFFIIILPPHSNLLSTTSALVANPLGIPDVTFYMIGIVQFSNGITILTWGITFAPSIFTFVAIVYIVI